jgi:hypothetical protein
MSLPQLLFGPPVSGVASTQTYIRAIKHDQDQLTTERQRCYSTEV